ncbi:MAG: proline--tRNA ligase [Armatimonadetes bacterium]|nr:proline--tRNA ligase [Armatimonadota bacterium]
MRASKLFFPTLREIPGEAELISHRLLLRAGYIRRLTSGVYTYLPLMWRVLRKIEQIVREEMDAAGAQEILMPVVQPGDLWQKSGRWEDYGKELLRFEDRRGFPSVLGPTHEEVIAALAAGEIHSYRQLPMNLYQTATKFRDEIRPRFGLLRGREFIMKDAYSLDADEAGLDASYQQMADAYHRVFARMEIPVRMVESDTGLMGGNVAHEFTLLVETDAGENTVLYCDRCDYAANLEVAHSREQDSPPPPSPEAPHAIKQVATPDMRTIEEVSDFLAVPRERLVKTLLYRAGDRVVAALVRGDHELNETKLKKAAGGAVEMADAETVQRVTGAPVGFAGPVGLAGANQDVRPTIVADNAVRGMANFVTGANAADAHLTGVNPHRDFQVDVWADIRDTQPGETCPQCDGKLLAASGIELGNIFKLGTKYSEGLGARFTDAEGNERPIVMGSYGIGITRTAQAAIEKFHDDNGMIWPLPIAPFQVLVLIMNAADETQRRVAEDLYARLQERGVETLLDDRDERAGAKFKDADLIGVPIQVVVGRLAPRGKVEVRRRGQPERHEESADAAIERVTALIKGADGGSG